MRLFELQSFLFRLKVRDFFWFNNLFGKLVFEVQLGWQQALINLRAIFFFVDPKTPKPQMVNLTELALLEKKLFISVLVHEAELLCFKFFDSVQQLVV